MQLRAAKLLVLPLLPFSMAGYCAPAASPRSLMVNEPFAAKQPLRNSAVSFEQLCSICSSQADITSGLPKSFPELLSASENVSIPIEEDRGDSGKGTVLLSFLAITIPLFGLMALPIDQRLDVPNVSGLAHQGSAVGSQVIKIS